ncbi:MAG: DNA cytosine methyltransferase [Blastocatellales bacterium]
MLKAKRIIAADLFCGAGGTSTGLVAACRAKNLSLKLIAVNHWEVAIATHSANHPDVEHLCANLDNIDPRKLVPGGKLDLLVASPECTHHSIARGGKPINDQSRASAWRIVEWCSQITVRHVLIENVKEFRTWGPLGADSRPLKRRKGETYQAFLSALRALGYKVEERILNAADFGDATSRERLFIQARRGRGQICWPEPTHAPVHKLQAPGLFNAYGDRKPYRPARDIIDWSLEGESIFTRKRPLSPNTMARIYAGLQKFCGLPFIVPNFGERDGQQPRTHAIDKPLPAVTSAGAGAIVQPFIVELRNNQDARSIDQPLSTVATSGAHHALCQPFIMVNRNNNAPKSVEQPIPTLCTGNHMYLIEPFLIRYNGNHAGQKDGDQRSVGVDKPVPTLDTSNRLGLVQPYIIPVNHGKSDTRSHSVDAPMPAITTVDAWAVIEPFIVAMEHGGSVRSINAPLNTITTAKGGAHAVVQPYLVKYNGTADAESVDDPLDTVTAKDRFGLVEPHLHPGERLALLDIRFRMLQPRELASAMGFPKTYHFTGNREQKVKQIGNAVPVGLAQALCAAALS